MKPLVKICLEGAGLAGFSLLLFLAGLIQRGLTFSTLSSGSLLRFATGLALASISGFFVGLAIFLSRRPAVEQRWIERIAQRLANPRATGALIFIAAWFVLGTILSIIETWLLSRVSITQLLVRYAPIMFLLLAFPALALRSPFLTPARPRIGFLLSAGAIFSALGILIQAFFISQLTGLVSLGYAEAAGLAFGLALLALGQAFWLRTAADERRLSILLLIVTAGLFVIQWTTWPRKLRADQPLLAILAPFLILGLPLLARSVLAGWRWLERRSAGRIIPVAKALTVCGLLCLAYAYYQADLKHARLINTSTSFSDEGNYMAMIKEARRLNFRYTGDQNRMPGYAFFQALFYQPEMSDAKLFERGKLINILLSLALSVCLFLIFLKNLSFFQATLLLLIVTFSLYIFKAAYIQAEISFYFISFLSFCLMVQMFLKPGWLLAVATGLVAGLGYLTKGTLLPSVALFAGIYALKLGIDFINSARSHDRLRTGQSVQGLAYLALVLVIFGAVIFPYINQMKVRFGKYFYNVNTTIYMWYDEMEQAYAGEARYHFTEQIPPDLPADQIPSLRNYLRTHTLEQAVTRFTNGVRDVVGVIGWQFSVTNYQVGYAWIFALAVLVDLRNSWRTTRKYSYVIAFGLCYFLGYFVAFAWYSPIASGRRFVYGLYIPFLFALFAAIRELTHQQKISAGEGKTPLSIGRYFTLTNLIISLTLIYNIWVTLTASLFFDRYGS